MRKQLVLESVLRICQSLGIFALVFVVSWGLEWFFPSLQGRLLQWGDAAFIVGIPASIIGLTSVLTITNPKNYFGFYLGVAMSVLLALQFYLQGSWDMVVLYIGVFIPFQLRGLLLWKRGGTDSAQTAPSFLSVKGFWRLQGIALAIVVIDYSLITLLQNQDSFFDLFLTKLSSASMIASSSLANYWMMYRKTDAWLCWVCYCLEGILLFVIIGNIFSVVLFAAMLVVNFSALRVWLGLTPADGHGWTDFFRRKSPKRGSLDRR